MHCDLLLPLGLLFWLLVRATPGFAAEESPIVYAPDVLGVDRLFLVALKVPTDAPEVTVTVPDSVVLLDRTRRPARTDIRRFYLQTVKAKR